MDGATLTLLAGLISCLIGISTFIVGMNSRAQKTGILEQKINQAVTGIEEIKTELKTLSQAQNTLAIQTTSQEERIGTLQAQISSLEREQKSLESKLGERSRLEEALIGALERLGKEVS